MKDGFDLIQSITAIIAVLIACVSIRYTMKSIKEQKKHEEMSVRPILNIGVGNYPKTISVALFNKGMGPATIEKVEIIFERENNKVEGNSIIKIINTLYPDCIILDGFLNLEGFTFLPNESVNIIYIEREQNANHKSIQEALACITGTIHFSDIYKKGVPYKFDLKRLLREPNNQLSKEFE